MSQLLEITDKDLLDELQRLVIERGVMLRSCRSGVKINLGFEGYGPMYEFFGGLELGQLNQGLGRYSEWHVEAGEKSCGSDIRALLKKAIMNDRQLRDKPEV